MMESIPCPICGDCRWDVDDCIGVEEALSLSVEEELLTLRGLCIDVYLSYHVSELNQLSESVKQVWKAGQKLYPHPFKEE